MDATLAGTGLRGVARSPRRPPEADGLAAAGGPLFTCGWDRVAFFHYEVDPPALQACTPFALDLRAGHAYVSLVAFTMRGVLAAAGPWASSARFVGAHYAPGFDPPLVGMGPPVRLGAGFSG